ncbi:MAG TPA: beta galactosidase jelly roll domain-containing protein [Bacteroidales bacterium]|nr:beta galactosidase jelly roll domain-containing protein [Bacteroidales bacterium]
MKIKLCLLACLLVVSLPLVYSQPGSVKQTKLTHFDMQSSSLVSSSGEEISSVQYRSKVYWFPVTVPSTVLTGLVTNKVYPDPYMGMNNMLIPDASDEFNKKYDLEKYSFLPDDPNPWKKPYWYRTVFTVPATDNGRHFQLIFKGINYRAAVWINGKQISDSALMAGMFSEYSFDVSNYIMAGKENALAVKIYPLDFPGLPDSEQLTALGDFFLNGGPTGDIGKNVTMYCSVGWDWMPPVRDRNMGIWLPVYLRTSGDVVIVNPKIVTDLPNLPDTTLANIFLNIKLQNNSQDDVKGKLTVSITPENFKGTAIQFSKSVSVSGKSSEMVDLNAKNTKELNITRPNLWWPNGYGHPDLYRIRLQYSNGAEISDDTTFTFGIRTVGTKTTDINGSYRRDFYVNGKRIQITGGAWVPDMMLNRDSVRYDYEMHLCRNSNINLVRIWGGGVTPCDEFWEAADRYGLLVWSDFWVTGDTQGEFKGSPDWPLESDVFKKNVISTILRVRNHPSLLVWTGGNEGHARKELYDFMRNSVISFDGTRPFIPSSSGFAKLPEGWSGSWPDNLPTGVYSSGPYTWQDPKDTYKRAIAGKDWVFKDETGLPSLSPYNIMPKIIPNLVWDSKLPFPLNNMWGYHDACSGNGKWDLYYNEMVKRYGEPSSMENFCDKMQLMNAIGYQGIFEAAGHKLNDIGGIMLWKLNAAFPSVVWQVYDWYLLPNAGYYFMQNACQPVHIQLNLDNSKVTVINRTYKSVPKLTAHVQVFNIGSQSLFSKEVYISMGPSEVKETTELEPVLNKIKGVAFIVLNLKDSDGNVISHNVYWLSGENDYRSMNDMPETMVKVSAGKEVRTKSESSWTIRITNSSDKIAFFIRPQLTADGEEVLPSFWTDSYFTLAPSETKTIAVSCPVQKINASGPVLKVSGWNVKKQEIILTR